MASESELSPEEKRRLAVAKIMHDYCDDAIVNDPLFGEPLIGKAAIAVHKTAEFIALTDVNIDVTDRWAMGNELVATWVVTGLNSGPFYNIPPSGRRIKLPGAPIVRRRDGLIEQETLYYDADMMRRQLTGEGPYPLEEEEAAAAEASGGGAAHGPPRAG